MRAGLIASALLFAATAASADGPAPGTLARYRVLPGESKSPPPFFWVEIAYGPAPKLATTSPATTWELAVFAKEEGPDAPLCRVRGATNLDPLADAASPLQFYEYGLQIPETNEAYAYRDACNPYFALTPDWENFQKYFLPRPVEAVRRQDGFPVTCRYLGHILTLREVRHGAAWEEWKDAKTLALDREMWVGTGRTVKDKEERRLPQQPERQNYTYVPWTQSNYETMIEAGFNYFSLIPGIEAWLQAQPAFYMRGAAGGGAATKGRNRAGDEPLRWPADCYRSNYCGPAMFIDEPACIMTGDKNFYNQSKWFSDATASITARVRSEVRHTVNALDGQLRGRGTGLGEMELRQTDFAAWETRYFTAFYQFAGGVRGFVHEGRYQLGEFVASVKASTGIERAWTAEEMLRYQYAIMRGAARPFGANWGTSIYGQADPAINPLAVTLAYDMGARYLWFWTSDHDHHMPWPEQLALARVLKEHKAKHPRPSIRGPQPTRDKAIVVPAGSLVVLESPTHRKDAWDLWWVRELDAEGTNEASQHYRRFMTRVIAEVAKCLDAKEDFDVVIDDGRPVEGYKTVVRVGAE